MNGNRIIVHTLIKIDDKYLVTKDQKVKLHFQNIGIFQED